MFFWSVAGGSEGLHELLIALNIDNPCVRLASSFLVGHLSFPILVGFYVRLILFCLFLLVCPSPHDPYDEKSSRSAGVQSLYLHRHTNFVLDMPDQLSIFDQLRRGLSFFEIKMSPLRHCRSSSQSHLGSDSGNASPSAHKVSLPPTLLIAISQILDSTGHSTKDTEALGNEHDG